MIKRKQRAGFTLIELMVVILIIAILGALGLVAYGQASRSARNGRREADMESVRQALILYRQEHSGCFPNVSPYSSLSTPLVSTYLSSLPTDPGANTYVYTRVTTVSGCVTVASLTYTPEPSGPAVTITLP